MTNELVVQSDKNREEVRFEGVGSRGAGIKNGGTKRMRRIERMLEPLETPLLAERKAVSIQKQRDFGSAPRETRCGELPRMQLPWQL